jgi:hypothetical protein
MFVSSTNVLALPLAQATIVTNNNEDWIDSFDYRVGPPVDDPSTAPPLDLTGIKFTMMARRQPDDAEVIVLASTEQGTIMIGPPPDSNFLIIDVPLATMRTRAPGIYVADMVAADEVYQRTIMQIELTIIDGITK